MVIQGKSSLCEFAIKDSTESPGEYKIFYKNNLVVIVQRNRKNASVVRNDLPIPDEEIKHIIEVHTFDPNAALYALVKHKIKVIRKLEKAVRNARGLIHEEDLLVVFRKVAFIEDVYL